MGILKNFIKDLVGEKQQTTTNQPIPPVKPTVDLECLDENGNIPVGWLIAHSDIKEMDNHLGHLINRYVYYRDNNGSVDDKIASINDVISYLEEYKDYCYTKNECYIKYYSSQYEHCHNSQNKDFPLIANYKEFLKKLTDNYDDLKTEEVLLKTLPEALLNYIKCESDGVLQKDIYKAFDKVRKCHIQDLLYQWNNNGLITKVKEGNSYRIYYLR